MLFFTADSLRFSFGTSGAAGKNLSLEVFEAGWAVGKQNTRKNTIFIGKSLSFHFFVVLFV